MKFMLYWLVLCIVLITEGQVSAWVGDEWMVGWVGE